MENYAILVSGIPRAGKTSFADYIERSDLELTHVPLDKYILPTPEGKTFLEWVKWPSCIDWELLIDHLKILFSGRTCFSPDAIWTEGKNSRIMLSKGGDHQNNNGMKMVPKKRGYLIAVCHSFSFPASPYSIIKVYIDTPDQVLASRLENRNVSEQETIDVLDKHLGDNPILLKPYKKEADIIINGTLPHNVQYSLFKDRLANNRNTVRQS